MHAVKGISAGERRIREIAGSREKDTTSRLRSSTSYILLKRLMKQYLDCSEYIDWKHPLLVAKANELAVGYHSDESVAKRCYEFVRDSILHSWDYKKNPVTCKASDVLIHGTGYCI